jgi:sugar-specific transcriptional regulator TrmB
MDDVKLNDLLAGLGLTEYEAKTLSTLFKLKHAEAPEISRLAQVPKTRVYDVLDKLVSKNLIIEIHGRPKMYRVEDSNKAITLLIESKKNQLNDLEAQADSLKEYLINFEAKQEIIEKTMKVKDKQDFEKILGQELLNAEKSIIGFGFIDNKSAFLKNSLNKVSNKNIEVKLINSNQENFLEHNNIASKFVDHDLNAFIIDDKKVIMGISNFKKEQSDYHFTIWNENKHVASALTQYFEKLWKSGKDVK